MSKNKKKEELAVGRDLTMESFRKPEEPYIMVDYRLTAKVIDVPTQYIMIFPKELPCAGLGCMIYNALERERGSNVVWRVR